MNRQRFFLVMLLAYFLLVLRVQAQNNAESNANKNNDQLVISVTSLEIGDKALNMTYEIRNESEGDVWLYTGLGQYPHCTSMYAGAYVSEDSHTLTMAMTSRSDSARFIRLHARERQAESVFMEIPVCPSSRSGSTKQQGYATNLAIELGYYSANFPEWYISWLELRQRHQTLDTRQPMYIDYFTLNNERLTSRDNELIIGETRVFTVKKEQVLRTVIKNVRIPYEVISGSEIIYERPNLISCRRVEIKYQPSMLDYFFPFDFQKNLLSPEELKYLQSEKILVLEDTEKIKVFANDVDKAVTKFERYVSFIARYLNRVVVICHYDDKPPLSFFLYNDDTIGFDGNELRCPEGFPSLKMLTPRIQEIDLRI